MGTRDAAAALVTPGACRRPSTIRSNARAGCSWPGYAISGKRDARAEHAHGIEARIEVLQLQRAADEQARGGQEHQAQRDLGRDQRAAQAVARAAQHAAPAARSEVAADVLPRRAQRGHQAEDRAGEQGQARR